MTDPDVTDLIQAFQRLFASHTLLVSALLFPDLQPEGADLALSLADAQQRAAAYLAALEAVRGLMSHPPVADNTDDSIAP